MSKVYIDFDSTMYNTVEFGQNLRKVLNKKDIDQQEDYLEIEKAINDGRMCIDNHLYADTIPFLEKIAPYHELYILTFGWDKFQLLKINNSSIIKYFKEVIVVPKKRKGELELDYVNSIFIDDNPRELNSINMKNPKRIIRIRRGEFRELETNFFVEEYENLLDINLDN